MENSHVMHFTNLRVDLCNQNGRGKKEQESTNENSSQSVFPMPLLLVAKFSFCC